VVHDHRDESPQHVHAPVSPAAEAAVVAAVEVEADQSGRLRAFPACIVEIGAEEKDDAAGTVDRDLPQFFACGPRSSSAEATVDCSVGEQALHRAPRAFAFLATEVGAAGVAAEQKASARTGRGRGLEGQVVALAFEDDAVPSAERRFGGAVGQ
jgi:hypothetical protein